MTDGGDHAAQLRRVVVLDGLADPAQAERAQRVALLAVGAVGRLDLGDDERHATPSPDGCSSAAEIVPVTGSSEPPRPSTRSTDMPRIAAISSGRRSSLRPAT